MTLRRLIIRNLRYYWRTGVVVVFGLAIATAVIVGSMLVGDSVTGSLRDTALARLGRIDYALTAPHFFRAELAKDLARDPALNDGRVVPLVVMRGAAESATTEVVVPNVRINGIDDSFWKLFPGKRSLSGRDAAVNASLARELGVKTGDSILIDVDKQGAVPSGTLFAHRSPNDTLRSLRLNVVAILDDFGVGGFRLDVGMDTPRSVFVSHEWLTSQIGKEGKANAIVVEAPAVVGMNLRTTLASACALADYGLKVVPNATQGYISLQSDEMLLDDSMLRAGQEAAYECGARKALTSVYLADRIRKVNGTAPGIAYSIMAAVQPLAPFDFASGGGSRPGDDGVWLNTWAAADLQVHVGDRLEVTYLTPLPDGTYNPSKIRLTLKGIVDMTGPAADRNLVPTFEGITNAESIGDWNTPFPVDLSLVMERDEAYWERYKTTPKAFVSLNTARAMWRSSPGPSTAWVTSIRLAISAGTDTAKLKQSFEPALLQRLSPEKSGMVFRPIRRIALASAKGSTDFGQLFMAMSFFLVLAGAGLAGMLMKLSAERRASETGVMLACGFTPKTAVLALLGEGALLSLAGTLLGLPLGVLYAWGIIAALKSWWVGAVGSSPLWLHVSLSSLAMSLLAGLLVGLVSLGSSALRLRKTDVLQLLAGWQGIRALPTGASGRSKIILFLSLAGAIALALLQTGSAQASFFGCGAALLVAGMSAVNLALMRTMRVRMSAPTLPGLAMRSAAANRGRSLLVVGLLACSGFVIITVAANTRDFSKADYTRRDSGAGGFALRAVSSSPIHYDLASPSGRAALGFSPEDEKSFASVRVFPFLMSSGEDISCLNLARPSYPRVLAVSKPMVERGGFSVQTALRVGNPWALLQKPNGKYAPIFGDSNSVVWNLHSGLGQTYIMPGAVSMEFVGLINQSIFAAELLMSEGNFRRVFPDVVEPRYYLIETPKGREDAVASALRQNLGRMGIEVRSTRELLNAYIGVQNTYLSMFLALGGLGLMLGTFGMVAVLLRSALERRREFALMLAQGFSRNDLSGLLLVENAGLLAVGLLLGAVSALVAVAPAMTSVDTKINWIAIAVVLAGMLVVGLVSCAVAARRVVSGPLMEALHGE